MRKKSHISLAKYLMNNMRVQDLNEHKKSFYIGSILPDLKLSFLTKKHNIDETFDTLIDEIKKITVEYDINKGINGYYARHLGVITHYLSDYCTYPHNSIFEGSITKHVYYEKELKFSLKEYFEREDVRREREPIKKFQTIDEITQFILKTHKEYLKVLKNVKGDIHFIIDLCYKVVDAILMFFEMTMEQLHSGLGHKHNLNVEYSKA
ncbi:MAG: zinc dependent phospholipase C family protein [Mobilitalea sp.]